MKIERSGEMLLRLNDEPSEWSRKSSNLCINVRYGVKLFQMIMPLQSISSMFIARPSTRPVLFLLPR